MTTNSNKLSLIPASKRQQAAAHMLRSACTGAGSASPLSTIRAGQVAISCAMLAILVVIISQNSSQPARQPRTDKSIARIDAGPPPETRQLVYYPEDLALLASLRSFTPVKAWHPGPSAETTDKLALFQDKPPVQDKALATRSKKIVITRSNDLLPPPRPGDIIRPAITRDADLNSGKSGEKNMGTARLAPEPAPKRQDRLVIAGVELPRFIPTGSDIMRRIDGLGDSIGRFLRVASR